MDSIRNNPMMDGLARRMGGGRGCTGTVGWAEWGGVWKGIGEDEIDRYSW